MPGLQLEQKWVVNTECKKMGSAKFISQNSYLSPALVSSSIHCARGLHLTISYCDDDCLSALQSAVAAIYMSEQHACLQCYPEQEIQHPDCSL